MELTSHIPGRSPLLSRASARIALKLAAAAVLILVLMIFAGGGVDFVYTGF